MVLFAPQRGADGARNHSKQGIGNHLKDRRTNGKSGSDFIRAGSFYEEDDFIQKGDHLFQDDVMSRSPTVDHFPKEDRCKAGVCFQKFRESLHRFFQANSDVRLQVHRFLQHQTQTDKSVLHDGGVEGLFCRKMVEKGGSPNSRATRDIFQTRAFETGGGKLDFGRFEKSLRRSHIQCSSGGTSHRLYYYLLKSRMSTTHE